MNWMPSSLRTRSRILVISTSSRRSILNFSVDWAGLSAGGGGAGLSAGGVFWAEAAKGRARPAHARTTARRRRRFTEREELVGMPRRTAVGWAGVRSLDGGPVGGLRRSSLAAWRRM